MKIPKVISKNNHEYIFVKQCNENLFQYKEMIVGYYECFSRYDLDLLQEQFSMKGFKANPDNVKIQEENK